MILKIRVVVSRENPDEAAEFSRWPEVASFEAQAPEATVWDVYRRAVTALTPEPDEPEVPQKGTS